MSKENIDWLKRQAKKLKKEKGITHAKSLDLIAKSKGYNNWKDLIKNNE